MLLPCFLSLQKNLDEKQQYWPQFMGVGAGKGWIYRKDGCVRVSTCWHPNQTSLYTENSKDPINGAVHWKQHHCVNSLCFLQKSKREEFKALFLIDWKLKKVRISELKFQRLEFPHGHPFHYHSKAHIKNKSYKYTQDFKALGYSEE